MRAKDIKELERTLGLMDGSNTDGDEMEFRTEPAEFELQEIESKFADGQENDVASDYVYCRNLLYSVIGLSTGALAESYHIALDDRHPRSFEVFNSITNTVRELAKDLLALQKVTKDITKDNPEFEKEPNTTINVNQFTGTTSDLIKMFEEEEKKNKTIDV